MQDKPDPEEILATVTRFLREVVIAETQGHTAFKARVAANAVDLVSRHITLAGTSDSAERQGLIDLLDREVALEDGNAALAEAIASGSIDLETPGLVAHLFETTMAKLAVDQPTYSGYRAALGAYPARGDA